MWDLLKIGEIKKKQVLVLVDLYRRMKYNYYNYRRIGRNTENAGWEVKRFASTGPGRRTGVNINKNNT